MSQHQDARRPSRITADFGFGDGAARPYRIAVVAGPDAGQDRVIEIGTVTVGTERDCNVVLSDPSVSGHHLELRVQRTGVLAADLDSTNGTMLGGARLGSVILTRPARLRLGEHTVLEIVPTAPPLGTGEYTDDRFGSVVGASATMRRLFGLLSRVARTNTTLLLEGETGTGKEAISEEVHRQSTRADGPFVVVDCASIPKHLIGSELFGHVRGAFTGAAGDKPGLIEVANGGTLFLDEIGELDPELQPQLLRVLEKREVRRIGDTASRPVDIRVVAATNRHLKEMVRLGQFREDLYYRLAVVRAVVPPLRDRPVDVPLLANHFAALHGVDGGLDPSLLDDLADHHWPGNVRELRNVVERALSLDQGFLSPGGSEFDDGLTPSPDAESGGKTPPMAIPFKRAKNELIETFERDYLTRLLTKHHGNVSRAAHEACIDRNYIHRLVKKYDIVVNRS